MAIDFVRRLRTDPNRCIDAGHPPVVVGRPALRAARLPAAPLRAAPAVKRAVSVALATLTDAQTAAAVSGTTGRVDALRGGTYVLSQRRVRFAAARVVTDAGASGTQEIRKRITRTRLRLRGRGVPPSQLTLRSTQMTTRITGTRRHRRRHLQRDGIWPPGDVRGQPCRDGVDIEACRAAKCTAVTEPGSSAA